MAINVKDKLITLESLGVAYSAEQDAREEADQALSTRIDNIVAPEGDPSLAEVADARTSGSTTYNTLKARLDADKAALGTEISQLSADLDNVLEPITPSNLYDNSNPTIKAGFLGGASSGSRKFSSSTMGSAQCLIIGVEPNTEYTASMGGSGRFVLAGFPIIPVQDDYGQDLTTTTKTVDGRRYKTFTTGNDINYLAWYFFNANDGLAANDIRATVMVVEGDETTPYTPYGAKELIVKKNNISKDGTAGQALMIDIDGESLKWGEPPATIELDNTLSEQGKAADSKAVGDALDVLESDIETQLAQIVLTDGVRDWLDDHPEAMIVIKRNGDAEDSPTLGEELLTSTGWTADGWTGDFSNGFTNTSGNTNPLSLNIPSLETGALYQFEITTSNAATNGWSDFYVSLGGSDRFETYRGGGTSMSYIYGLICGSSKTLTITPRNSYTGTITNLSLKKVTNSVGSHVDLYDTDGNIAGQMRTGKSARQSVYTGKNAGVLSFWGAGNTAVGDNAFASNTSGFWNTAIGRRALEANQNGSRNIAIGYIALLHNTGGDRNVAIGTFALEKNTTGRYNIAINADSLQNNTTGYRNIGIGVRACVANTTGNNNIGIGDSSIASNTTGSGNVAVGRNALNQATGSNNVAIGNSAGDVANMTGNNNIVIGSDADVPNASASNQMVLGNASISTVVIAGKTINFNQDGTVTWS